MDEREYRMWASEPLGPKFTGKRGYPEWDRISPGDIYSHPGFESVLSKSHFRAPTDSFLSPRGVPTKISALIPLYVHGPIEFILVNNNPTIGILPVLSIEDDEFITETGTYKASEISVVIPVIVIDYLHAKPGSYCIHGDSNINGFKYNWIKDINAYENTVETVHIEMSMDENGALDKTFKERKHDLRDIEIVLGEAPDIIKEKIRSGIYDMGSNIIETDYMITPLKEDEFPRR